MTIEQQPAGHQGRTDDSKHGRLRDLAWDPWRKTTSHTAAPPKTHTKILIIGAGYGGLLFAVRLLKSGFSHDDILLVDSAGGFGGTWYWNRYPGLMCDIESYIYMPLLEETNCIPTRKYVGGEELRNHAQTIGKHWNLTDRTLFRTTVDSLTWNEDECNWTGQGRLSTGDDVDEPVTLTADFVIVATGTLNKPKIPDLPGMDDFQGPLFHTARWDYSVTGGSPDVPDLENLKDKHVGVIGTGSTAVQVIPHLAKWSKKLCIFQRSPAHVGEQKNEPTDPAWWKQAVASTGPGWQRKRSENFNSWVSNPGPGQAEDLVGDGWTRFPTYTAAIGGAKNLDADFLEKIQEVDRARKDAVQQHIREIVQDEATADALVPSNDGWCKRPCFHQNYLETYNLPHVQLVKTPGPGVTGFTPRSLLVGDDEYELDVIVLATGYTLGSLCPSVRARLTVIGQNGLSMEQKWAQSPATLHGVTTRGFPNLFFPGVSQAGVTANQSYMFDRAAEHVAYILRSTLSGIDPSAKIRLQPTEEAEEGWATQCVQRAAGLSATDSCRAGSYTIAERNPGLDRSKIARHLPWGLGMGHYVRILEDWRARGGMEGLEIGRHS